MALAEIPPNDGGEYIEADPCEGCALRPREGQGESNECTVLEALRTTLSPAIFQAVEGIISRPGGEFVRKDIVSGDELGVSMTAQNQRYYQAMAFLMRDSLLSELFTRSGVTSGRKYNFNADGLPEVCRSLKNGAALDDNSRSQVSVKKNNGNRRPSNKPDRDLTGAKLAVIRRLTESTETTDVLWASSSEQREFRLINELYGNLAEDITKSDLDIAGSRGIKKTYQVPTEQRILLQNHYQEIQDGLVEPTGLSDSGNEVWNDIAEYFAGSKQLPLLAKASLAELKLIKEDLKHIEVPIDEFSSYIYAKIEHINRVISEILSIWGIGQGYRGAHDAGMILKDNLIVGWQDSANCLGLDPDLFFPERGASTREAKAVCEGCTVRKDCLKYSLVGKEKHGIWGGFSERERRRIRKALNQKRRATEEQQ